MTDFKVGDRVLCTGDSPHGEIGTIIHINYRISITFDKWRNGHECRARGNFNVPELSCWNVSPRNLIPSDVPIDPMILVLRELNE